MLSLKESLINKEKIKNNIIFDILNTFEEPLKSIYNMFKGVTSYSLSFYNKLNKEFKKISSLNGWKPWKVREGDSAMVTTLFKDDYEIDLGLSFINEGSNFININGYYISLLVDKEYINIIDIKE